MRKTKCDGCQKEFKKGEKRYWTKKRKYHLNSVWCEKCK